jgi:acyl-[acyl-carrier-protein]-phospholipid O-acyltransferase/long-chain-fatty-acid--[acyl-carrier-protein] ligase
VVFTIPWLLFSAHAGWLADRFPKHHIVVGAKGLEVLAMLCGAAGVLTMNWALILTMVFLMSLQSTIFSPSLNGSIPELYPREYVVQANARLKMVTTSGILAGMILAGILLEIKEPAWNGYPLGRVAVAASVLLVAGAGWLVSFAVPSRPAADPTVRFPWSGPWETLRELWRIRRDRLLWTVVGTDMFVWFLGAFEVLVINRLGKVRFGFDERQTSYLLAPQLVGVVLGGAAAGRFCRGTHWYRSLAPALFFLGVVALLVPGSAWLPVFMHLGCVGAAVFLVGVAGGLLLVPLESFLQIRPRPEERGEVIAAANFAGFAGIAAAGVLDMALPEAFVPSSRFTLVSVLALLAVPVVRYLLAVEGVHLAPDAEGEDAGAA